MGKCIAYVAAAVVFIGIGALVAGLAVWYHHPGMTAFDTKEKRSAQCVLSKTSQEPGAEGTLYLEQLSPRTFVHITGNITGLSVGLHGFHVHEFGVNGASGKCLDAKAHYNPEGYNHSAPNATKRHVGDLGNIESVFDSSQVGNTLSGLSGIAYVDIKDHMISLWGKHSIVGRAIVVHAGEDDLGLGGTEVSLKTGDAGGRLACCTIFIVPSTST